MYTSEDNESFADLMIKQQEEFRRIHWWMYEEEAQKREVKK